MQLRLSPTLQQLIQELVDEPNIGVCGGGLGCPSTKMRAKIEARSQIPFLLLKSEQQFLSSLMTVQEDGRNCPAADQRARLKAFLTDAWRHDVDLVTTGIQACVVRLEPRDLLLALAAQTESKEQQ